MSQVTTHVLDSALGKPAETVAVALYGSDGQLIATGETNGDGRVPDLGPDALEQGTYRLVFETADYFTATGQVGFYPRITIDFDLTDNSHYHVPVLLSPFAYSTYRGS